MPNREPTPLMPSGAVDYRKKYIESVEGEAHQSACDIIEHLQQAFGELELALREKEEEYKRLLAASEKGVQVTTPAKPQFTHDLINETARIAEDSSFGRSYSEIGRAIRSLKSSIPNARILQEGEVAVPREPTKEMLEAVSPFPEHLRAEHPDANDAWHNQMEAATLADQAVARQTYLNLLAALKRGGTESGGAGV